jgi:hypothetical protein
MLHGNPCQIWICDLEAGVSGAFRAKVISAKAPGLYRLLFAISEFDQSPVAGD